MHNPFSGWYQKAQSRGEAYTALDAMKLFAVISMTADHIGYYFFPESMWWRVVGRVAIPVWFFLVGYSRSRSIDPALWIYGILLTASEPVSNGFIFPLTVLITFIGCRLALNMCEDRNFIPGKLPEIIAVSCFLSLFTAPLLEYGTEGFLFVVFGRMIRTRRTQHFLLLCVASYLLFIAWQFVVFPFNIPQGAVMMLVTAGVVWWLARCPNTVIWPQWSHSWWKTCITMLSRNTMPYYFYHRIVLEILSILLISHGIHFVLRWGLIE